MRLFLGKNKPIPLYTTGSSSTDPLPRRFHRRRVHMVQQTASSSSVAKSYHNLTRQSRKPGVSHCCAIRPTEKTIDTGSVIHLHILHTTVGRTRYHTHPHGPIFKARLLGSKNTTATAPKTVTAEEPSRRELSEEAPFNNNVGTLFVEERSRTCESWSGCGILLLCVPTVIMVVIMVV